MIFMKLSKLWKQLFTTIQHLRTIMIDKKVLTTFEQITYLPEYQKKQLCIMLLGSMLTPSSCNAISDILNVLSEDMNEEWKKNNYPNQLNDS